MKHPEASVLGSPTGAESEQPVRMHPRPCRTIPYGVRHPISTRALTRLVIKSDKIRN